MRKSDPQCLCEMPQKYHHVELETSDLHSDEVCSDWCSQLPAVHYCGSGVHWIDTLDLLEKLEHANRGERYTKVRPAGEVKLGDQPRGSAAIWSLLKFTQNISNML